MSERGNQIDSARNGRLIIDRGNNRIIGRDPLSISRLLIAAEEDSFSMKVSMDGIDVTTANDDELIFNSDQNIFKIVASGTAVTGTYTITGTSGQWKTSLGSPATIPHGLDFVPAVIAYVQQPNSGLPDQYILVPTTFQYTVGTSAAVFNRIGITVDSDNIYILDTTVTNGAVSSTSAGGLTVKYFLLQESSAA